MTTLAATIARVAVFGSVFGGLFAFGNARSDEPMQDIPRFHHVHLITSDPAAAIAFYTKHFPNRKEQYVDLTDAVWTGDSWLLFTQQATPPKTELTSTIQHIGWGAREMQSAYRRQIDLGASIHTPMRDISHMVIDSYKPFLFSYVNGADGIVIELNSSRNDHFGHIHLSSRNPQAAGEWYRRNLGLVNAEKFRSSPLPAVDLVANHISFLIASDQNLKANSPDWKDRTDFESTQGHVVDHLAFSVGNLERTIERLRANGVNIVVEPHRVLSNGKLHNAFIEGPDHALIEIVQDESPRPAPLAN